ncbi:hypothetical protein EMPS_02412 [Entomortierella parvispora]|uniref:F-box domain-containing protein n=1 Tax=Entomortierella parvispora TaxID=205924 RepID=A0A9P3H5E0_9FUNG|nr:hypothetical protein EMPS_02412 [Entomortierella parvispora]
MPLTSIPPSENTRSTLSAPPTTLSLPSIYDCPCPRSTSAASQPPTPTTPTIFPPTTCTTSDTSTTDIPTAFSLIASTTNETQSTLPKATTTSPTTTTAAIHSRPGCGHLIPEECLERIFEYLAKDLSSLHSLLLVSKAFFRIAMPLLYACPFDLLESDFKLKDTTKRHAELLYLLLNCNSRSLSATTSASPITRTSSTPSSTLSSAFNSVTDVQEEPEPDHEEGEPGESELSFWERLPPVCERFEAEHQELKSPLVDYLAAYNHHFLCMNLSSTFRILFPNIQRFSPRVPLSCSPPESDLEEGAKPSTAPTTGAGGGTTVTTFTRNAIERSFLLHRPDLVRTISLPIQRLRAFLSVGSKLSRLTRFELYGVTWYFDLDETIKFLTQHGQEFGTIQELKMTGPADVRQLQKPSLVPILRTLKRPRLIDLSRYKEATKDLNNFEIEDLSRLETLLFDLSYVPLPDQLPAPAPPPSPPPQESVSWTRHNEEEAEKDSSSLAMVRRCTRLTHLQIGVQSADAFSWAVNWSQRHRPLMPLKTLNLSSNKTPILKTALEDAVLAFQHTLESIRAVANKLNAVMEPSTLPPSLGWSWTLPRLKSLWIRGEIAAWFEFESLRYCPMLTELNLTLHPYTPPKSDHLNGITLAPNLTSLALVGRWTLSDDVMTRLSQGLPKLTRICLDNCQTDALTTDVLCTALQGMALLEEVEIDLDNDLHDAAKRAMMKSHPDVNFMQWNSLLNAQM